MVSEKRVRQQIQTVERLLHEYAEESGVPLARFLSGFYKRNRQMGSKDRRMASRLVYHYFRLGDAARGETLTTRLAMADFLCSDDSAVASIFLPEFDAHRQADLSEKISLLEADTTFRLEDVFPFRQFLSAGIDRKRFIESLFVQPDLYIRLRPPYRDEVIAALDTAGVDYRTVGPYTVALPNGTALDRLEGIAGQYEVQDYSSQQTGAYFGAAAGERWWDACAGAGGKSLLLIDQSPEVNLLVSDTRRSILRNLDERFERAGITSYRQRIVDLTKDVAAVLGDEQFDGIILDAPCTGSGTWGRTPEMLAAFDSQSIARFAALQRQLAAQVITYLKPGKALVYITCSVFAEENERVVEYLQGAFGLRAEQTDVLHGYRHKADSMFVARLIKG
ncbi:RsmB/NOP family class I SAM-dependent RNA methyltransferase [Parapedobacter sp. 10938]|uniref:RsmB/NOP family class I SAM-dependent RNA methyltransferase n=1 Tax=Parapedobacter flavus TaxID=3110225 RepID=UPI002DB58C1D|nr:RsmB/NOP family class I SAM-dependent RNA methyltransferase [Parapedobacter sp. 10938]MEC3881747.1 RsmB/NOP family class I SAM-dependent RNA methyltransferase [Parapedobacter sp. 10938]